MSSTVVSVVTLSIVICTSRTWKFKSQLTAHLRQPSRASNVRNVFGSRPRIVLIVRQSKRRGTERHRTPTCVATRTRFETFAPRRVRAHTTRAAAR